MSTEDVHRALSNRFSAIHGAQGPLEVTACTGLVLLAVPMLATTEESYRTRAIIGLLNYLALILHSHGTPPERSRDLLTAVGSEIELYVDYVLAEVKRSTAP